MLFSSITFLCLFFPIVLLGYYILPKELRNEHLLIFSLLFYTWGNPKHFLLLLASILVNYFSGILLEKYDKQPTERKILLVCSVIANIGLLVYFKYFNFIIENINGVLGSGFSFEYVVLPIGISFFTFQGLSYVIDVYRRNVKGNPNLFDVALYISLFPLLIAGPIVRYIDVQEQIKCRTVSIDSFASGIQRFVLGLSKKVLLADTLGNTANNILNTDAVGAFDTPTAWFCLICYAFQIYFDFSGYSDMAIGLGRMFGFEFPENFNYPYISKSITEFWRRWHISLSTWFREYLYIPLGGNRRGNVYFNLFIVFCATGIWHSASWNFLLFGLWHGLFLILEKLLMKRKLLDKIPGFIRWASTMLLVLMGWVVFRLPNLALAANFMRVLFGEEPSANHFFTARYYLNNKIIFTLFAAAAAATPYPKLLAKKIARKASIIAPPLEQAIAICLFVLCLSFIISGSFSPFIYFQF